MTRRLRAATDSNAIPAAEYDDVIFGCVDTIGALAGGGRRGAIAGIGSQLAAPRVLEIGLATVVPARHRPPLRRSIAAVERLRINRGALRAGYRGGTVGDAGPLALFSTPAKSLGAMRGGEIR